MNTQNHTNTDQLIREALMPFIRQDKDGSRRIMSLENFNPAGNFLEYFDQCITERDMYISNKQAYEQVKRKIIEFFSKKKWIKFQGPDKTPYIPFHAITPERLAEMEQWLLEKKRFSKHTTECYMKYVASIFKRAEKEGIITRAFNPFGTRKHIVVQERKNWIDTIIDFMRWIKDLLFNLAGVKKKEAVQDLQDVDMEEFAHLELRKPKSVKARDFFRIVYLSKCIPSSLFRLKWSNIQDDLVTYTSSKMQLRRSMVLTRSFILTEELKQLIEKYGNPDKSSDAYIFPLIDDTLTEHENRKRIVRFTIEQNRQLAKISKDINVKKLSLYYAYRLSLTKIFSDSIS